MPKAVPKKTGRKLEDLMGMLKYDDPAVPIEELCKSVEYNIRCSRF